jgi:hypothetical protein
MNSKANTSSKSRKFRKLLVFWVIGLVLFSIVNSDASNISANWVPKFDDDTLEITVHNNSSEAIKVSPHLIYRFLRSDQATSLQGFDTGFMYPAIILTARDGVDLKNYRKSDSVGLEQALIDIEPRESKTIKVHMDKKLLAILKISASGKFLLLMGDRLVDQILMDHSGEVWKMENKINSQTKLSPSD